MVEVEGVVQGQVLLTMANGKPLKTSVTDDAVIVTVIQTGVKGGLEVQEHDCFTDAMRYLLGHSDIVDGDFRRIFIGNVEELDREQAVLATENLTSDRQ